MCQNSWKDPGVQGPPSGKTHNELYITIKVLYH